MIIAEYEDVVDGQVVTVKVLKYCPDPDFMWEYAYEDISSHTTQFKEIRPDND
jgi:hypothetical protein